MVLEHIAGRVWRYPHHPDPARVQAAVVIVAGERGSVVIDAGNSPDLALAVQQAMRAEGLPEARWLVYTHHHWDHVWGAMAFADVEIVGHELTRDLLVREAARPWSHDYLADQIASNPRLGPSFQARARAMVSFAEFEVLPPQRTFSQHLEHPAGVRLRHVGGHHAPDSIVVSVPDSSVLLLGDCYFPPPFHLREPDDDLDLTLLRSLVDADHRWYVDSHSDPWTREQFAEQIEA